MALKLEIEEIRESVKAHDRQIDGLIRALTAEHKTVSALSSGFGTVVSSLDSVSSNLHMVSSNLATLAASVVARDRQIQELGKLFESLRKEWQAYLRRLPPQ